MLLSFFLKVINCHRVKDTRKNLEPMFLKPKILKPKKINVTPQRFRNIITCFHRHNSSILFHLLIDLLFHLVLGIYLNYVYKIGKTTDNIIRILVRSIKGKCQYGALIQRAGRYSQRYTTYVSKQRNLSKANMAPGIKLVPQSSLNLQEKDVICKSKIGSKIRWFQPDN